MVPEGAVEASLKIEVVDKGGNTTTLDQVFPIATKATIFGSVVDVNGNGVPYAIVATSNYRVPGPFEADVNGSFVINNAPTHEGKISLRASAIVEGQILSGVSPLLTLQAGDQSIGAIVVSKKGSLDVNTADGQETSFPVVTTDSNNNVHLVWLDQGPNTYNGYSVPAVYYQMTDAAGKVLISKTRVSTETTWASRPQVVVDSKQNVHIFWGAEPCGIDWCWGKSTVEYMRINTNSHAHDGSNLNLGSHVDVPEHSISTDDEYGSGWVSVAIDSKDRIHIVWRDMKFISNGASDESDTKIKFLRIDAITGAPLLDEVTIAIERPYVLMSMYDWHNTVPGIGVDGDGNSHILWTVPFFDGNTSYHYGGRLKYVMLDANTASYRISETTVHIQEQMVVSFPRLAVDSKNRVHISFSSGTYEEVTPHYMMLDPAKDSQNGDSAIADAIVIHKLNVSATEKFSGTTQPAAIALDGEENANLLWLHSKWGLESDVSYQVVESANGELRFGRPLMVGHAYGYYPTNDQAYWVSSEGFTFNPRLDQFYGVWTNNGGLRLHSFKQVTGSIKGRLLKENTLVQNAPISLRVNGTNWETTTDSNGLFVLNNVPSVSGEMLNVGVTVHGTVSDWVALATKALFAEPTNELGDMVLQEKVRTTISTIAGTGTLGQGLTPSMQPLTTALNYPENVVIGPDGSLFIADGENHRVLKLSNGILSTVAGTGSPGFQGDGGPATSARLRYPYNIEVGKDGTLYIADNGNARVRKVDTNGVIHTIAGTGVRGFNGAYRSALETQLWYPYGLAVKDDGTLFVADGGNAVVYEVSPTGDIRIVVGTGKSQSSPDGTLAVEAGLIWPGGLAISPAGELHIGDELRVVKIDEQGLLRTVVGTGTFRFSDIGDGGPAIESWLAWSWNIDFGVDGSLYVADTWNHRVRRVMPDGFIDTIAGAGVYSDYWGDGSYGGDGGDSTAAYLNMPSDVSVAPDGTVYVADYANHVIRKLTPVK